MLFKNWLYIFLFFLIAWTKEQRAKSKEQWALLVSSLPNRRPRRPLLLWTSLSHGPPCPGSAAIVMSSRSGCVPFVLRMMDPNTFSMKQVVLSVLTALICKLWRRADTGSIWSAWRGTPLWEQMVAPLGLCRARIAGMRSSRITETTQQCLNGGHRAFAVQDIRPIVPRRMLTTQMWTTFGKLRNKKKHGALSRQKNTHFGASATQQDVKGIWITADAIVDKKRAMLFVAFPYHKSRLCIVVILFKNWNDFFYW